MSAKIAVLMGGRSLERSVSLKSGRRVAHALKERGYDLLELDVEETLVPTLMSEKPDLVYIALHGKYGEDGTVQELLEILGIPYTGPGPLACITGFNKVLSKEIFKANGLSTPDYYTLSTPTLEEMGASKLLDVVWDTIGSPLVVKPASQGSALGLSVVKDFKELPEALLSALGYDQRVLLEKFIPGVEVSVSVIGNGKPEALPAVEIVPEDGLFDFDSRYTAGKTDYFVPARLSAELSDRVSKAAIKAHEVLRCKDISRVDLIIDENEEPFILELNISPGMTETSLLPLAADAAGMSFEDLVERLVRMALGQAEDQ